uniref:Uncharacterized protein n=1 Tax=Manihot esculenta TaxID=3983 RepID=A0A2C9VGV3_MANES
MRALDDSSRLGFSWFFFCSAQLSRYSLILSSTSCSSCLLDSSCSC